MVRPERLELPAYWFEASRSIRLSYGRTQSLLYSSVTGSSLETEIKLAVADVREAKRSLVQNGFRISRRRVFERNLVFDTGERELRGSGKLLRLRQAGKRARLTFKGPPESGKHKRREEREVAIGDLPEFQAILERLGYFISFVYEKYRTEYVEAKARGVVTIDETPIGDYLEIEGSPHWIDATASRLGYGERDYITVSYGTLYAEVCRRNGVPAGNMVFAARED